MRRPFAPPPGPGAVARPPARLACRPLTAIALTLFFGVDAPAHAAASPLPAAETLGQGELTDPTRPSFTKGGANDGPHFHGVSSPGGIALDAVERLLYIS